MVRVWDLASSEQRLAFKVPALCMALAFMDEDESLAVATRNNLLTYWDIIQNTPSDDPIDWTGGFGEGDPSLRLKRPTVAAFSVEQNLLAVIYCGEDILLWSLDGDQVHDMYTKESGSRRFKTQKAANGSTTVWAVAFSTTAEASLLVATYSDGDAIVYDTATGAPRGSIIGCNAQTIACSPDGRTLATADSQGVIQLFDLRTLRLIHRLRPDIDAVRTKMLAFTSDNLRLLDIRGNQFKVWDPAVLLRYRLEDENSDIVSSSPVPAPADTSYSAVEAIEITAMVCPRNIPVVFCGKDDGSLHVYDIAVEPRSQQLYTQTPRCAITFLHFDEQSETLTCSDISGKVTCRKVTRNPNMVWMCDDPVIDLRNDAIVIQAIPSEKHGRLLVSTSRHDTLWTLTPGHTQGCIARINGNAHPKWLTSSLDGDLLVRIESNVASFYRWETFERVRSVNLASTLNIPLSIESIAPFQHPQYFVTMQQERPGERGSPIHYHLWNFRDFILQSVSNDTLRGELATTVIPALDCSALGIKVDSMIGVANGRIVFLGPENWVCSAKLGPTTKDPSQLAEAEGAVRHFFIPDEWTSLINRVLVDVRPSGEIVFAKRAELAVIRRGLDITEKGVFNSGGVPAASALARRPAERKCISV